MRLKVDEREQPLVVNGSGSGASQQPLNNTIAINGNNNVNGSVNGNHVNGNVNGKVKKDYEKILNYQIKRNLVQDMVHAYKQELLDLLSNISTSTATEDDNNVQIQERLASLVNVNPVSTTTDSNLLDGVWEFAYVAPSGRDVLSIAPRRLVRKGGARSSTDSSASGGDINLNNKSISLATNGSSTKKSRLLMKRKSTVWPKLRNALSTFVSTSTREIVLEGPVYDEDPYLTNSIYMIGGLLYYQSRYLVNGLTRTTIDASRNSRCIYLGPICISLDATKQKKSVLEILYLDNDLCISTTDAGIDGPMYVHTKSEKWTGNGERRKRKLKLIVSLTSWLSRLHSPLRLRKRLFAWSASKPHINGHAEKEGIIVQKDMGTSNVKVLKLGEVEYDPESVENESWDGDEDPFVNFDANARQDLMKSMSISEIEEARRVQKKKSDEMRKNDRKQKQFKPPSKQ